MTEVLFYHLQNASLESVLPGLLERSLQRGWRALVRVGNPERLDSLTNTLWTYSDDSFLPHGTVEDGPTQLQPILLTTDHVNANNAQVVFLVDGAEPGDIDDYERCVLMFDGGDPAALASAREYWKRFKEQNLEATYWQQNDVGKWEKKA